MNTVNLKSNKLVLGVDGGGSKTNAWLGRICGGTLEKIGEGQGGAANPRSVGFQKTYNSLLHAIQSAFEQAGLASQPVDRACLCLAGAGRSQEREAVLKWASELGWTRQLEIVSEAEAVLAATDWREETSDRFKAGNSEVSSEFGHISNTAEVALICGTGSLAWGRCRSLGLQMRCGGWGFLMGDEGSGFWLGKQVLEVACRVADGRSQEQSVLRAVLEFLEISSPDEIVLWCYQDTGSRERIAKLAPLAFHLSDIPVIDKFINQGALELAEMIAVVLNKLNAKEIELAIAGSVVANQSSYRARILEILERNFGISPTVRVIDSPVSGALSLAAFPQSS
jgi:N-acetylglucosamine kinase-like BadF-type ATPase